MPFVEVERLNRLGSGALLLTRYESVDFHRLRACLNRLGSGALLLTIGHNRGIMTPRCIVSIASVAAHFFLRNLMNAKKLAAESGAHRLNRLGSGALLLTGSTRS